MQFTTQNKRSIANEMVSIDRLIPNPFIIADEAGEIMYANQLAMEIFGYPDQTLLTKNLESIIQYEFPEFSTNSVSAKCLGRRQNREQVELEICYRAIRENFVNHWCITINELTPHQNKNKHPQNKKRKMEALNRELNNRLKELQIFSYAVSHDLQAPLRGIDGYMNHFIKNYSDQLDDKGKRLLTKVTEQVNKLQQQLLQLDYLLKLGTVELQWSYFDMYTLTNNLLKDLNLSKVIQMTIKEGTHVTGDATLIKQVLSKLISNAMKFSPQSLQSKIEIGCKEQGAYLHFYIKDFGIGFDEKYKGVVFDHFQQLQDPQKYPGIGLSLATVKQIIDRHGGKVWATGKENEGSTFYFSFYSNTQPDGRD